MPDSTAKGKILRDLNKEQKRAVTYGEGPLLIVAGAGTGKTQVITRRIAYLIVEKKAKPEEILGLTFTEKAALEMEERVDILVPYGYTEFWISTFHAFGDRVLRENALELGLTPDFQVLSVPEQVIFFREHLFEFELSHYRPLGNPTRHIQALLTLIGRAKDEDITPRDYLEYTRKLEEKVRQNPKDQALKETLAKEKEVALCYKKYQELLAREGKIDFGDQITLTLKLFREHPSVLERYQRRFKYILIDEFQDTNYSQFQLVKLLARVHRNITVVGDDDQSIYKFRGAAISNILGFLDTYPEAHQIVLTRNYRSPQEILDSAYRLIQHNNPDRLEFKNKINKKLIAAGEDEAKIRFLHYDNLLSEAEGVAELIKQKVQTGGYRWSDFAILVRANNDADPFLRSLNMAEIPWRFSGNEGLYDQEEVRLLICFLKSLVNPEDSISLYYLTASEIYRMPIKDLTLCMNYASRKHRPLFYVFSHLHEIPELTEELSSEGRATIERILRELEDYLKQSARSSTGEILYQFITRTGFLRRLTQDESRKNERKVKNIARFFEIVQNSTRILEDDRPVQFVPYLDTLIKAGDNPAVSEAELETDAVNILTIHKAKGLEFPVVIMVSLINQRFPSVFRREAIPLPDDLIRDILPGGDFHRQEERRLFYVGMTRAQRELYLTSAEDYGGKKLRKVSPFVLEALDLSAQDVSPRKCSALEVIERNAPRQTEEETSSREISPDEVLSLSHLQVDDYLTCPLKYKYIHILRVPIMQHHAVIYGKALHDAVQSYYRYKIQGKKLPFEELVNCFESSWVNEGFISREHEERRFEEGKRTLAEFYKRAEKENVLPAYVEKEFNFMLDTDRVTGRWDRVDVVDDRVTIIDFKSSQVDDEKKAKKRAKNSLQLSIYALAYYKIFEKIPDSVRLYFLETGIVGEARLDEKDLEVTAKKIKEASQGIRARVFEPRPDYIACRFCPYQSICPDEDSKKYIR